MIFSKREQFIFMATILVVAILLLDRFVVTPLLEQSGAAQQQLASLSHTLESEQLLLQRQHQMSQKWDAMRASGLEKDAAAAESQLLHIYRQWSSEAGLTLISLKPERPNEGKYLREVVLQASSTGPMKAVSRFLWLAETAKTPIRIKQLQLGSRKEGADDLSLTVTWSTLYVAQEATPAKESTMKTKAQEP
jgi:hypothetical protein